MLHFNPLLHVTLYVLISSEEDRRNMETSQELAKIECHSERCPVCNGHTTVNWGKETCKACQGKGFVIVPNKIEDRRIYEKGSFNR